jgi:hypothetical protein
MMLPEIYDAMVNTCFFSSLSRLFVLAAADACHPYRVMFHTGYTQESGYSKNKKKVQGGMRNEKPWLELGSC